MRVERRMCRLARVKRWDWKEESGDWRKKSGERRRARIEERREGQKYIKESR